MKRHGVEIKLRAATLDDRRRIYRWLAQSDATAEMMGPPWFPDHPVPTYATFCKDYDESAFGASDRFRVFVIIAAGSEIGAISYFVREDVAELDIWIASRRDWGKRCGPAAIERVVQLLEEHRLARAYIMRPSARNRRAIASYRRSGFRDYDPEVHDIPAWCLHEGLDYADAVVLVRVSTQLS